MVPHPHLGFIGCRDGVSITAFRLSGRVLLGTRHSGGLPSDHHGPFNGLETFVTTQGPSSRPLAIDNSPPTSRSIVASSYASGTQSNFLVCWATQLFIRRAEAMSAGFALYVASTELPHVGQLITFKGNVGALDVEVEEAEAAAQATAAAADA